MLGCNLSYCQVYNNGLLINANCRTKDALEYIRKEFKEFSKNLGSMAYDETDRGLDCLFTGTSVLFVSIYSRKTEIERRSLPFENSDNNNV